MRPWSIFIGFDPRESDAFAVARASIRRHLNLPVPIFGLVLADLKEKGLYRRPTETRASAADRPVLWDVISDAPMATEFSISRFLVLHLAKSGFAMFCDADVMARANVAELFMMAENDPSKAVWCVQHDHKPSTSVKMDGQLQTSYGRKNWSSVTLWNVDHPANKALTLDVINSARGRDLHQFFWLADSDIGRLGPEWNYLVGESAPVENPKIVHLTLGVPSMAGYENCEFSDEWRDELYRWAR